MSKKKVEKELEVKENGKEIVEIFRAMARENPAEEMSEVHKEKLDKLVNETVDRLVGESSKDKVFTNIKKLKCDYTTYKEERTKYNMPVETNCAKCGKSFEAGEEIYTAFEKGKLGSCIICENCANN